MNLKTGILAIALLSMSISHLVAQETQEWTKKSAAKWLKSGTWKKGLKLNVYKDVDVVEFAKQYHAHQEWWDKSFAYLRDHQLNELENGKLELDPNNVTVSITDSETRELDKTKWESHRSFIDLQYIVRGKERMIVADTSALKVTSPYNDKKDVANYSGEGVGKSYIAKPGTFYLFFPADAHRPVIHVKGYDKVKKVVVKIRYS